MVNYFILRLDIKGHCADGLSAMILSWCIDDQYAFCIEGTLTDNPHMHWYIETNRNAQQIRYQLRKIGLVGNGCYSLKTSTKHPIEYLAYISKETTATYGDLPACVLISADERVKQIKSDQKLHKAKAKKRPVWVLIMEDYYLVKPDIRPSHPRIRSVRDAIIEYYRAGKKQMNPHQMQNILITIVSELMDQYYYIPNDDPDGFLR